MAGSDSRQNYRGTTEFNEADFVVVAGSFETDGAAAPVNVKGKGFTVAYNTVGVYDITFTNAYPGLVSCVASVQADTADTLDALAAQVGTYVPSTGVLQVLTYWGTDLAAPALADGNGPRVNFIAVFHKRDSLNLTYA